MLCELIEPRLSDNHWREEIREKRGKRETRVELNDLVHWWDGCKKRRENNNFNFISSSLAALLWQAEDPSRGQSRSSLNDNLRKWHADTKIMDWQLCNEEKHFLSLSRHIRRSLVRVGTINSTLPQVEIGETSRCHVSSHASSPSDSTSWFIFQ